MKTHQSHAGLKLASSPVVLLRSGRVESACMHIPFMLFGHIWVSMFAPRPTECYQGDAAKLFPELLGLHPPPSSPYCDSKLIASYS